MADSFDEVIAGLRGLFGNAAVLVGDPVSPATIDRVARELGATFPADYRAFIEQYGFLSAGPDGDVVVFGIAPDDIEIAHVVDVRVATRMVRDEIASRLGANPALAEARGVAAVFGAAADLPAHSVHVFDQSGELRWLHLEDGELEESLGFSFADFVADHVTARVAADSREASFLAHRSSMHDHDRFGTRTLYAVAPDIARLMLASARLADSILTFETRAEIREVDAWVLEPNLTEDGEPFDFDDGWSPADKAALREVLEAPDDKRPLLGDPVELADYLPELIELVTGLDPAVALSTGEPLARALGGDRGVWSDKSDPENKAMLIAAEDVKLLARLLDTLETDAHYSIDEEDPDVDVSREDLGEVATQLRDAYVRAATAGHAMVIRYSR